MDCEESRMIMTLICGLAICILCAEKYNLISNDACDRCHVHLQYHQDNLASTDQQWESFLLNNNGIEIFKPSYVKVYSSIQALESTATMRLVN